MARIRNAEKYVFSLGAGDAAEEVGKVNATLFLAKIHFIQEQLGFNHHAMVVGAPDFTFQTSPHKFHTAVPEGALVLWGDGKYDFLPAETEVDFCGMLVGAVDYVPLEEVLDRVYAMGKRGPYSIGGTRVDLKNFSPGNHFLNIYKVQDHNALDFPEYVAVLHTASDEMRDHILDFVRQRASRIHTPFGESHILSATDASEYTRLCKEGSNFSRQKRQLLFEEIFGHNYVISNENHYDLIGSNEAIIGCNTFEQSGALFVITTSDRSPAYLLKSKANLSREKIEENGFYSRRCEHWVYKKLLKANIIPHASGHRLVEATAIEKVILYPQSKVVIPRYNNSQTTAYTDMNVIHRRFRFEEILERVLSLDLAERFATLEYVYGIKADL